MERELGEVISIHILQKIFPSGNNEWEPEVLLKLRFGKSYSTKLTVFFPEGIIIILKQDKKIPTGK